MASTTQKQNNIPELWSSKDIADWLGYSLRHVRERVVHDPSFPKRLPQINDRWFKDEVLNHFRENR